MLLPRQRYLLSCLCDKCQNLSLKIQAVSKFVKNSRSGSARLKVATLGFPDIPSASSLMNLVLHPISEGADWHSNSCFMQKCDTSQCGSGKFHALFEPLLTRVGGELLDCFEHEKKSYLKPDGSNGTKWELVKKEQTLTTVVVNLHDSLFNAKEPYLLHSLKKCLGVHQRQNLRRNIDDKDLILYNDFSKALERLQPEQLKSEVGEFT